MSLLLGATHNREPSKQLAYSSLTQDERARKETEFTFNKAPRFVATARNGDLGPLITDLERDHAAERGSPSPTGSGSGSEHPAWLPANLLKNTNTRTVFKDTFYETHQTMHDKIEDPAFRSSVMKVTPHKSMDTMCPTDPRQQHVKPAYEPQVGPGFYEEDPMHTKTTGMPDLQPGDSVKMLSYAKNPYRQSPAFKSPPRGAKTPSLACTSNRPPPGPDYKAWLESGFATSNMTREQWTKDKNRPTAVDVVYDTSITEKGTQATCAGYASAPDTPSYKAAFHSGMPRLVALPGGAAPDTRIVAKSHAKLSNTSPSAGPGAYALETPRFKSFNAAYHGGGLQYSLAASAPPSPSYARGGGAALPVLGGHAPTSPTRLRVAGGSRSPLPTTPLVVEVPASPPRARSGRSSPLLQAATPDNDLGSLDETDWEVHQAIVAQHVNSDIGRNFHLSPAASGRSETRSPLGRLSGSLSGRAPSPVWSPTAQSLSPQDELAMQGELEQRATSFPEVPVRARRIDARFDQLMFMKRAVPYNDLIKKHIKVSADLKQARNEARGTP